MYLLKDLQHPPPAPPCAGGWGEDGWGGGGRKAGSVTPLPAAAAAYVSGSGPGSQSGVRSWPQKWP